MMMTIKRHRRFTSTVKDKAKVSGKEEVYLCDKLLRHNRSGSVEYLALAAEEIAANFRGQGQGRITDSRGGRRRTKAV